MNTWTTRTLLLALVVLGIAAWLRFPFMRSGMPYFYDEDEAHHHNRVVNMVKRGDFDPQYFLKPSLHFYLRMPVVAASFLASVRAGEVRSVKEIVTRDTFGVGDYSFSASPQKIAKWNRAFSVAVSLLVILLTIVLAGQLGLPASATLLAAALVGVSPALVQSSATIGVDGIVTACALLATILALRVIDRPTLGAVIAAGVAAGCAIGTKYNAAPIALLPLLAVVVARGAGVGALAAAILTPCLAFLATTPFLLANLPLFLDHLGYEIWHYGIAGHEGHTGEPGLGQALFYAKWLWSSALGVAAFAVSICGIVLLLLRGEKRYVLFVAFPLLYLLLMISQKANFTRNMHLMIPFLACGAAFLAELICSRFGKARGAATFFVTLGLCAQPFLWALNQRTEAQSLPESRLQAAAWLMERSSENKKTALSGALQFEPGVLKLPGVTKVDLSKETAETLKAQGFERIVAGAAELTGLDTLTLESSIPGELGQQRIVKNPEIRMYQIPQ
jgi:hypothetical protein